MICQIELVISGSSADLIWCDQLKYPGAGYNRQPVITRLGLVWYFPDMSGWTSGPILSGEVRFFPDIDRGTSGGDFENHAEPKKQVFRCF